jgi:hypothetical protein
VAFSEYNHLPKEVNPPPVGLEPKKEGVFGSGVKNSVFSVKYLLWIFVWIMKSSKSGNVSFWGFPWVGWFS